MTGSMPESEISPRESEVLTLLGEHLTNAEIGARLFISARTVESHVASLLRKLGAADRRALAAVAAARAADPPGTAGEHRSPPPRLPTPLTPFVGRRVERVALVAALAEHRLVTAIGPGGVGKTRLALEVGVDLADDFPDGVWYVDLVPVTDPTTVAASVARAAGLGEQLGRSSIDTLVARFEAARALLVLDNCEHVIHGVARLVEVLLGACPDLRVLATSQARLVVPHERPFPVDGMATGADGGDAVALFVQRALLARWEPEDADGRRIAALCDGLEGNALAIELAAARAATLGLDGLEAGLHDRLSLLAGGARSNERHGSLRSAVAWTDGLLSAVDRAVLRRCSVFAAPFHAGAASDVVADASISPVDAIAALGRLADHSLLVVVPRAAGTRYRMLETIRQYGHERLAECGELEQVRTRHRAWCASAVDRLRSAPAGRAEVNDVTAEAQAALSWADGLAANRLASHDLALGLADLAFQWGMPTEAQGRYEQAAALAADDRTSAAAFHSAAIVAACRLVGDDAVRLHRAAADAARRAGDHRGAALDLLRAAEFYDRFAGITATFPPDGEAGRLLATARELAGDDDDVAAALAVVSREAVDPAAAIELGAQSGDGWLRSSALDWRIALELSRGEPVAACATVERRFDVLRSGGVGIELAFEFTDALHVALFAHLGAGRLEAARRLIERRRDARFLGDEDDLAVEGWLAVVSALLGDWRDVVELDERAYAALVGAKRMAAIESALPPAAAAMVHGLRGDETRRRRWLDIAEEVSRTQPRDRGESRAYAPVFAATVALHRGDHDEAAAQLAEEPTALDTWQAGVWRQWYAALWAEAGVAADLDGARDRIGLARRIAEGNPIAGAIVERTSALVAGDSRGLRRAAATLERAGARYQYARTLVLAGGAERRVGTRLLEELGAVAMEL